MSKRPMTVDDFIAQERDRFEGEHNNMLARAFDEVTRYRGYLDIIVRRYTLANETFLDVTERLRSALAKVSGHMNQEQMELLDALLSPPYLFSRFEGET